MSETLSVAGDAATERVQAATARGLAALRGLSLGDALGMPTQSMSRAEILEDYGDLTGFLDAGPRQRIAAGMRAGSVTDDTEQTGNAVLFGAIYLFARGVVKVAVVVALPHNKTWAHPWMIVALVVFIGYQVYRIALNPTAGQIALTVFDVVIVGLTWREYGLQRRHRTTITDPGLSSAGTSATRLHRV